MINNIRLWVVWCMYIHSGTNKWWKDITCQKHGLLGWPLVHWPPQEPYPHCITSFYYFLILSLLFLFHLTPFLPSSYSPSVLFVLFLICGRLISNKEGKQCIIQLHLQVTLAYCLEWKYLLVFIFFLLHFLLV